jgi:hypothetical protein
VVSTTLRHPTLTCAATRAPPVSITTPSPQALNETFVERHQNPRWRTDSRTTSSDGRCPEVADTQSVCGGGGLTVRCEHGDVCEDRHLGPRETVAVEEVEKHETARCSA